jgi:predicted benzoate:H+ symporter BenE
VDAVVDFLTRDIPLWVAIVAFLAGLLIRFALEIADAFSS